MLYIYVTYIVTYIILMWYESKNNAEIVEDSTSFCPTRFNELAAQG